MRASASAKVRGCVVDFLGFGDHAGDRAEAAGDPDRAGVDVVGQGIGEHDRVELIGLAVDVEIGARKVGAHQGRAVTDHAGKDLVDIAVFRASEAVRVELGAVNELRWIDPSAVGRIEHHRRGERVGLENVERRIEPLCFENGVSAVSVVHVY